MKYSWCHWTIWAPSISTYIYILAFLPSEIHILHKSIKRFVTPKENVFCFQWLDKVLTPLVLFPMNTEVMNCATYTSVKIINKHNCILRLRWWWCRRRTMTTTGHLGILHSSFCFLIEPSLLLLSPYQNSIVLFVACFTPPPPKKNNNELFLASSSHFSRKN